MKILSLLFLTISFTVAIHAAEPTLPKINYKCSSDMSAILGSDSSVKYCWPYKCDSREGTAVCEIYCNTSEMCQTGQTCDTSSSRCVPSR